MHSTSQLPPYMVPFQPAPPKQQHNPANTPPFRLGVGDTLSSLENSQAFQSAVGSIIHAQVPTAVNTDLDQEAGYDPVVGDPFTPGDAETPGAAVAYEERHRSGTATLCGFSEFVASTPAKKYRTITFSGNTLGCSYTSGTCTTFSSGGYSIYSGGRSFDAATCVEGSYTDRTSYNGLAGCAATGGSVFSTGQTGAGWDMPSGIIDTVKTATVWSQEGSGTCIGSDKRPTGNTRTQTLSAEDTDADAITRWLATSPAWSSFAAATLPDAEAPYTARTTGFSFTYGEAELKINATGFPAAYAFTARVVIAREHDTTAIVTTVSTSDYALTADGSGNATVTVAVEAEEAGYTYRVDSVTFYRAP